MNRFLILSVIFLGFACRAEYDEKSRPQQRMEERPTSTSLGGSRSGDLEKDKKKDIRQQHGEDKQKFLYEYEGVYRDGL